MKTLENRENCRKIISHALKLYMGCNGNHEIHITQIVEFSIAIVFLYASSLIDKFCIRYRYRGEGIRLIVNIVVVPGHCLLFIFQWFFCHFITICNNADLGMKSVYLCFYSRFSLICLLFMNIHEYANEITYIFRNDITTCNKEDFWMKSVDLWVFFYDFPSCLKYFIIIHEGE